MRHKKYDRLKHYNKMCSDYEVVNLDDLDVFDDSKVRDVIDVIDEIAAKCLGKVYVAGGFACVLSGRTGIASDVDVYCLTQDDADRITKNVDILLGHKGPLGNVTSVRHRNFEFDIIHIIDGESRIKCIEDIVDKFDFSWCMAGYDPSSKEVYYHPDHLEDQVYINADFECTGYSTKTHQRVHKYCHRVCKQLEIVEHADHKRLAQIKHLTDVATSQMMQHNKENPESALAGKQTVFSKKNPRRSAKISMPSSIAY